MKRTLAITAATALLALSLAGCGDMSDRTDGYDSANGYGTTNGTTATDTMHNNDGTTGTGMTSGAAANNATANGGTDTANNGLGSVTGAVNRGYGSANYGGYATSGNYASNGNYAISGNYTGTEGHRNASTYTATNNGGLTSGNVDYTDDAAVRRAALAGDNYARMLENGRVHDTDGFLLDGENAHYHTF